jgi:hypothetical protein
MSWACLWCRRAVSLWENERPRRPLRNTQCDRCFHRKHNKTQRGCLQCYPVAA